LLCRDARIWILAKIFEPLIQDRFFFGSEVMIFDLDCAPDQLLSFCKRQLRDCGENFGQTHGFAT